jgi:hypothetical protein
MNEFRAYLCGEKPGDPRGRVRSSPPAANITDIEIHEDILRDLHRRVVLHVGHGASQLDDRVYIREKLHAVRGDRLCCHALKTIAAC